mgnify:FL=1
MSSSDVTCSDSNLIFKNVIFKGSTGNYIGIKHVNTVIYDNCSFTAKRFLYGENETFNNCSFTNEDGDYNLWTYGAKNVVFDNCHFYGNAKSVLIYNETNSLETTVTIKNCTFEGGSTSEGKAAIETDPSLMKKINLNIESSDFSKWVGIEKYSNSNIWGNKKNAGSDKLSVTINQTVVL